MKENGTSIYCCGKSNLPKPEWGRYTQNGKKLYAHIYEKGIGPINFRGLGDKIKSATLLCDGSEIEVTIPWNAGDYKDDAFIDLSTLSVTLDTSVELELK